MSNLMPDTKLSKIVNALINRKIISSKQLDLLVKNRYIDNYVYLMKAKNKIKQLVRELKKYNIDEQTVTKIRNVYKEFN